MKRILASLAVFGLSGLTAAAEPIGIAAGAGSGTYIEIVRDIAGQAADDGMDVTPKESRGSVENLLALHFTPGIQMALVQSDSLAHLGHLANLEGANRTGILRMIENTRMVMPLYTEEVHILAKPGIATLADLNGRTISIGPLDSGTFMTAYTLIKTAGIKPAKVETFTAEEALVYLKEGLIDAMVYVAGQPVRLFEEQVSSGDGLVFVDVTDARLNGAGYRPVSINAGSYPWLTSDVGTVGVTATLVAWNYRGPTCGEIEELARSIASNLDDLRATGHRKWLEVDPRRELAGWEPSPCVGDALSAAPPPAGTAGAGSDADTGIGDLLEGLPQ